MNTADIILAIGLLILLSFIFLEIHWVNMCLFYTICCLMDEVSFGSGCKKGWHAVMLEGTEQRGGEKRMSVLHGWVLWQLPLLWVQTLPHLVLAPYPLPRHSHVAVQPSQICRALPDVMGLLALKALFLPNEWRTTSLNHCFMSVQWYCWCQWSLKLQSISHQTSLLSVAVRTFLPFYAQELYRGFCKSSLTWLITLNTE